MRIKFFLPIEPFSVNRMYYRDRRMKSQDYRDWELSVINALNTQHIQEQFAKIREVFDERRHGLLVRFDFYYPRAVLFNKQGTISSRAEDLTNIEKPLLDIICLPKFHVQQFPVGIKNLNCDDKHVLRLISSKRVGKTDAQSIGVQVAIVNLPTPVVGP